MIFSRLAIMTAASLLTVSAMAQTALQAAIEQSNAADVAAAQAAAAKAAAAPDGIWKGVAAASLMASSGNSSTQALSINLDIARTTEQDKISLTGLMTEGRAKDVNTGQTSTTAGKWGLAGQYNYNLTKLGDGKWFGVGRTSFEHDRVTDMSLRSQFTAGMGYHMIAQPLNLFDVIGGLSFTQTRYGTERVIDNESKKVFNSIGLMLGEDSTHFLSATTMFKQHLEIYPSMSGEKNLLIKFTGSVAVAMTQTTSLTFGLFNTYTQKVPAGIKKNDLSFFTGVSVQLGR